MEKFYLSFYFDGTATNEEVLITKEQYDRIKKISGRHMWYPETVSVAVSVDGEERKATVVAKEKRS